MKLSELQAEHKTWVDTMFPGQPPIVPAAGMIEEAAELLHAVLALEREKIWGPDPRYPNLQADIADAIGDCAIYACSLCNASGWNFADLSQYSVQLCCEDTLRQVVGLVEYSSKTIKRTNISKQSRVVGYLARLRAISAMLGHDFHTCLIETWNRVKTRKR